MRRWGGGLLALLLVTSAAAEVAEPPGFWTGAMLGETPATLTGASVVDTETVAGLKGGGAILLDVAGTPAKPASLAPNMPWLPTHLSIPGAVWLPGAGLGDLTPEIQGRFAARIAALTGGDKGKPIVVFCHPKCWGSWNAGKRLVALGYARVYWFQGGVEGWQEKFEATAAAEDAAWKEQNR